MTTASNPTVVKQKGEFSLDLKDDDDDRDNFIPVKLKPHQDLDELLHQPIGLPPPRKNMNVYPISILKESQDCREAIDLVITHISHQDLDISFQNLVQVKNHAKFQIFRKFHIIQLILLTRVDNIFSILLKLASIKFF